MYLCNKKRIKSFRALSASGERLKEHRKCVGKMEKSLDIDAQLQMLTHVLSLISDINADTGDSNSGNSWLFDKV